MTFSEPPVCGRGVFSNKLAMNIDWRPCWLFNPGCRYSNWCFYSSWSLSSWPCHHGDIWWRTMYLQLTLVSCAEQYHFFFGLTRECRAASPPYSCCSESNQEKIHFSLLMFFYIWPEEAELKTASSLQHKLKRGDFCWRPRGITTAGHKPAGIVQKERALQL